MANRSPAATHGWVGAVSRKKIAANEMALTATANAHPARRALAFFSVIRVLREAMVVDGLSDAKMSSAGDLFPDFLESIEEPEMNAGRRPRSPAAARWILRLAEGLLFR